MANESVIHALQKQVVNFGEARSWGKFHSPKNLSMALSVEASELLEIFQWLSEQESKELDKDLKINASYEIADIFMYVLLLCERLNIDLEAATREKIAINEARFQL